MSKRCWLLTGLVCLLFATNAYGQGGPQPEDFSTLAQTTSITLGDYQALDVSDDGQTVAVISINSGTYTYDLQNQAVLRQLPRVDNALALSADGQTIVLANDRVMSDSPAGTFGYQTDTGVFYNKGEAIPSSIAIVDPTQPEVIAGFTDGRLALMTWDTVSVSSNSWQAHGTTVRQIAYIASDNLIVSADDIGTVKAWTLSGDLRWQIEDFTARASALAARSDVVAVAVQDRLYLLDTATGQIVTSVNHQHEFVTSIGFHNGYIVTGGWDGYLRWWSVPGANLVRELLVLDGEIHAFDVANDAGHIIVGASDGFMYAVEEDIVAKELPKVDFYGDIDVEFRPDQEEFVITTMDGRLRIWSLEEQNWTSVQVIQSLPVEMTVSKNGRWLVIAYDNRLTLWEIDSTPVYKTAIPFCSDISRLSFLGDTSDFLVATAMGHLTVWNAETAQIVETVMGLEGNCHGDPRDRVLSFVINDDWLVTGHSSGDIRFWSRGDYSEISDLSFAVEGPVFNLFFYNDQLLERDGRREEEIDRYDFALSGWSLEPDHQRLWYYPLNTSAILHFSSESGVLVHSFAEGFSVITVDSLADANPVFIRFDTLEQASEIEIMDKVLALVIGNEIQIWQPE